MNETIRRMLDRAWEAHERGENQDALKLCNEVLELDPNSYLAYSYRASVYVGLKEYARAIDDANKSIQIKPTYYYSYNNRGCAYLEMGNYEQALSDFSESIKRVGRRKYPIPYFNRAGTYIELKEYEKAIDDCDKAIEFKATCAEAYYNRGCAYEALGETAKAQADFVKAKQLGYKS